MLALGVPIGDILAKNTSEELKDGRRWFFVLILICFAGAIISLIYREDALLFTFLFIAIVTSRSFGTPKTKKISKKRHILSRKKP